MGTSWLALPQRARSVEEELEKREAGGANRGELCSLIKSIVLGKSSDTQWSLHSNKNSLCTLPSEGWVWWPRFHSADVSWRLCLCITECLLPSKLFWGPMGPCTGDQMLPSYHLSQHRRQHENCGHFTRLPKPNSGWNVVGGGQGMAEKVVLEFSRTLPFLAHSGYSPWGMMSHSSGLECVPVNSLGYSDLCTVGRSLIRDWVFHNPC